MSLAEAWVGALGWWHHDNLGDTAMLEALRLGLAPHRLVPIEIGFPINADILARFNRLDFVLLGGGTLIPGIPAKPFDTFDSWESRLTTPLGVLGMGVDAFPEQASSAIRALMDRSTFFYVRDTESRRLLGGADPIVAPDLSFALPLANQHVRPGRRDARPLCGVNLRRSASVDPDPWLDVLSKMNLEYRGIRYSSFPSWDEESLLTRVAPNATFPADERAFRDLDLMLCTAYHSVLFAVQAGIPVLAIDYAPKVRNFMRDAGLEEFLLPPDGSGMLPSVVSSLLDRREAIVEHIDRLRQTLHFEAQAMLATARDQIAAVAPHRERSGPEATVYVLPGTGGGLSVTAAAAVDRQSYPNTVVESGVPALNTTGGSAGEDGYVAWLRGDARLDEDALDYLVSILQIDPSLDMVYTDYYLTDECGNILARADAPPPEKLQRRNVIGPVFLLRKAFLHRLGGRVPDGPADDYALWLRAHQAGTVRALHAPVARIGPTGSLPRNIIEEREVRRKWRSSSGGVTRLLWDVLDTEAGERLVIGPVAAASRWLRSSAEEES